MDGPRLLQGAFGHRNHTHLICAPLFPFSGMPFTHAYTKHAPRPHPAECLPRPGRPVVLRWRMGGVSAARAVRRGGAVPAGHPHPGGPRARRPGPLPPLARRYGHRPPHHRSHPHPLPHPAPRAVPRPGGRRGGPRRSRGTRALRQGEGRGARDEGRGLLATKAPLPLLVRAPLLITLHPTLPPPRRPPVAARWRRIRCHRSGAPLRPCRWGTGLGRGAARGRVRCRRTARGGAGGGCPTGPRDWGCPATSTPRSPRPSTSAPRVGVGPAPLRMPHTRVSPCHLLM